VIANAIRTAAKVAGIRIEAGKSTIAKIGRTPPIVKAKAEAYAARQGLTMSF
jgi:hypothetical protein